MNFPQFLNWIAIETLLTGILFCSYYLWIRRFRNSIDRFNFLYISFITTLLLPWIPMPEISEPIFKTLLSEVATAFDGKITFLEILPLFYFSVLAVRGARIFNSFRKLNQLARSASVNPVLSEFPILFHPFALPPMTLGITKPKILLPKTACQALSRSELNLIIQHEEEHIRRGDSLSNLIRILVKEILFFSPFIWKLSQKFEEEMEISVDTAVLSQNSHATQTYGKLLLKMADLSRTKYPIQAVATFLSNSSIKNRILSMKQLSKRRSKILNSFALAIFMILSTLGISLFGSQQAYSNSIPQSKPVLTESDLDLACKQSTDQKLQISTQK